ncbi:hypothetical protein SMD11_1171 [Streptomyces albireticuli]|uniref:MarR family transcriptional regulator n=1 Tax=Streptomyces albireticuli TaxID=1940 RepID=A0A1Z2KXR5_9ACTN|nr:hypothetical protein [Streptomyces albireticuli]ARZ66834.1 hypothetical protein SMD11_1171 [Streptomyces albireticuli]
MDFRITAGEEQLLFVIVAHLDSGSAPTVEELSAEAGHDAHPDVASLRDKGWVLIDRQNTVIALSPMAVQAVRNLRFGQRVGA